MLLLSVVFVSICLELFFPCSNPVGPLPCLGFPILGVEWQKMENPDLRVSMGMKPDQKGVRIRRIEPTAPESHVLKPSDVILSFDGVNIANDGTSKIPLILCSHWLRFPAFIVLAHNCLSSFSVLHLTFATWLGMIVHVIIFICHYQHQR